MCKFIIGKIPLYLLAVENVDFTTLFLNLSKIQRFEQYSVVLIVQVDDRDFKPSDWHFSDPKSPSNLLLDCRFL